MKGIKLIGNVSRLGLCLPISFVGMEISAEMVRRVEGAAVALLDHTRRVNPLTGTPLAMALRWSLASSLYPASVLAMGCSAAAEKALTRARPAVATGIKAHAVGMVIMEELISLPFLAIVGGLVVRTDPDFSFDVCSWPCGVPNPIAPEDITRLRTGKGGELFPYPCLALFSCPRPSPS